MQKLVCKTVVERNKFGGWRVQIVRNGAIVYDYTVTGVSNIQAFLQVAGEYLAKAGVEAKTIDLTLGQPDVYYIWREEVKRDNKGRNRNRIDMASYSSLTS